MTTKRTRRTAGEAASMTTTTMTTTTTTTTIASLLFLVIHLSSPRTSSCVPYPPDEEDRRRRHRSTGIIYDQRYRNNIDPTTDGVLYVRSSISSSSYASSNHDYLVAYDYRPEFPPYRRRYDALSEMSTMVGVGEGGGEDIDDDATMSSSSPPPPPKEKIPTSTSTTTNGSSIVVPSSSSSIFGGDMPESSPWDVDEDGDDDDDIDRERDGDGHGDDAPGGERNDGGSTTSTMEGERGGGEPVASIDDIAADDVRDDRATMSSTTSGGGGRGGSAPSSDDEGHGSSNGVVDDDVTKTMTSGVGGGGRWGEEKEGDGPLQLEKCDEYNNDDDDDDDETVEDDTIISTDTVVSFEGGSANASSDDVPPPVYTIMEGVVEDAVETTTIADRDGMEGSDAVIAGMTVGNDDVSAMEEGVGSGPPPIPSSSSSTTTTGEGGWKERRGVVSADDDAASTTTVVVDDEYAHFDPLTRPRHRHGVKTAADDHGLGSLAAGLVEGEEEEEEEGSIMSDDGAEYEGYTAIPATSIGGVEDTERTKRDGATIRIIDADDDDEDDAMSTRTHDHAEFHRREGGNEPSPARVDSSSSPAAGAVTAATNNNNNNRDANRQFVDGLDEIDKLFESVEVPDELDVGADGSSMQDVLVGQGIKIAWKHARNFGMGIKLKFDNIKRAFDDGVGSAWPHLSNCLLSSGGGSEVEDEEGNISLDSVLSGLTGTIRTMDDDRDYSPPSSEEGARGRSGGEEKNERKVRSTKNKNKRGEGEGMDGRRERSVKLLDSFPLIKSPGVKRIWKFAKRKFEQARHLLDDFFGVFEGADDDDGYDFELNGKIVGDDYVRLGEHSATGAIYEISSGGGGDGRRFGSEIDEAFLKSRYEALMKAAANDEK